MPLTPSVLLVPPALATRKGVRMVSGQHRGKTKLIMTTPQTTKEWVEEKYPRHVASLRRQQATHERAVERKADAQVKPITNRRAKAAKLAEQRAADRRARRAKHARKSV